jgi:arylsulfatase A-like enzyme
MITGQFAHTIGTEKLSSKIGPSTQTIPDYLSEQGYFTGLMLKNHMEAKGNQRFQHRPSRKARIPACSE